MNLLPYDNDTCKTHYVIIYAVWLLIQSYYIITIRSYDVLNPRKTIAKKYIISLIRFKFQFSSFVSYAYTIKPMIKYYALRLTTRLLRFKEQILNIFKNN